MQEQKFETSGCGGVNQLVLKIRQRKKSGADEGDEVWLCRLLANLKIFFQPLRGFCANILDITSN